MLKLFGLKLHPEKTKICAANEDIKADYRNISSQKSQRSSMGNTQFGKKSEVRGYSLKSI